MTESSPRGGRIPKAVELERYLDDLASGAPTPGGGSAATVVAACAAALVAMVARITRNNVSFAAKASEADSVIAAADTLRAQLLSARGEDEAAYGRVVAALALPKATDGERAARARELQDALGGAAAAPLHVAGLAVAILELNAAAAALGNAQLASDVTCAAAFARAALAASAANVRINHAYLRDRELVRTQEHELAALERTAAAQP